jgi:uncharacterized phiE125 gp8 family phage protein
MWRAPVTTVAPLGEPVGLAQARAHLRLGDDTGEDATVGTFIEAARGHVEARTATRLMTQTVVLRTDQWADLARLPLGPVQSVSAIAYVDAAGAAQTLAGTVYEARLWGLEPGIVLKHGQAWPTIQPGSLISITAVVGYGAEGAQPPDVIRAMLLLIGDYDAHRSTAIVGDLAASVPMETPVAALLENHRLHLI